MKIKSLVDFSGVPKGTTGTAERDPTYENNWKITWDDIETHGLVEGRFTKKPLADWFDDEEFKKYLVVI